MLVSPGLVAVVSATFLVWITLLTAFVLNRCREPWRDDGRPVFKRLPNGRVRFSWGVANQLVAAQRGVTALDVTALDEQDTDPIGLWSSSAGGR